ncbi:hypothetical protein [Streptantibioticus ferralitis]|uniref:DUF4241 domain-containing protein n=1 Tax=Streptantibioticus ferralitis TaxID=236510 RepID=A0ABT5Z1G7_9ACTN|nr:hypothetical protein [Streptantibioticus ferralitis]MDF2257689.1 hypothetical protein [Streptantibioticus ferralitis]
MEPIAQFRTAALPDRGVIQIYDADAYLGDSSALDEAEAKVVAGNGYHLYILSLQPAVEVEVVIRVWEAAQDPIKEAEGCVPVTLESETGVLVVNQFTLGPAGTMDLPKPGVYDGHVSWTAREAVGAYYGSTIAQGADEEWGPDQFGEAWQRCPVTERYILDLWFVGEPEPVDEDDE